MIKNKEMIKEIIRYLIIGVCTTLVSLGIYYALVLTVLNPSHPIELQLANIISWFFSVLFAYITNRLFVFKSKSNQKVKEGIKFFLSRVVTLLMDMGIMWIGVSYLKANDKWIKILSQVIVIVANYILSKFLVFKKNSQKEKKKKENLLYYSLYFLPVLVISKAFSWGIYFNGIFFIVFFILAAIEFFQKQKHLKLFCFYFIYISIELAYLWCKKINLLTTGITIIEWGILPIALLYFKEKFNFKIKESFYLKLFVISEILCLGAFGCFEYLSKEMILFLSLQIIPVVALLFKHKNQLFKIFIYALIITTILLFQSHLMSIIFFLSIACNGFTQKETESKNSEKIGLALISILLIFLPYQWIIPDIPLKERTVNLSLQEKINNLEIQTNSFASNNIEEQIFGLPTLSVTQIDLADIFYSLGILGMSFYLLFLLSAIYQTQVKSYQRLALFLAILLSWLYGGTFTSGVIGLFLGTLILKKPKEKRKILVVSNMYPSKKYKHYGIFVENMVHSLEKLDFEVDKVVKKKQISWLAKFFAYIKMYITAILKSNWNSYDYIYVHFISQSAFCVLLAKWFSPNTTLIYHVHGNDIIPTNQNERKNIKRSQFVLPYADQVIVPSIFFKKVLEQKYHVEENKIIVSPSGGVNRNLFSPKEKEECQKKLKLDPNWLYIGFVSRIEENKGWDTFLYAIKELEKEKYFSKLKLIVIGNGQEKKQFQELLSKLNLKSICIQIDFVNHEELSLYYNAMDVLIYSTKLKESLGLTPLEAMACETIVIGRKKYGPKEYLKDKENCLAFEKDEELPAKLKEFFALNPTLKKQIQKQARLSTSKYDVIKVEEQMKEIFH